MTAANVTYGLLSACATSTRSQVIDAVADYARLLCAADVARIDEAKSALERALGSSELYGAPLLVAANKQDCEDAESAAALADRLGDTALRATRPCRVHGISAYTGQGIADGLRWLIEEVKHTPRAQMLRQRTQYL